MRERLDRMWRAFANFAILFSFIVNCVLVLTLLLAIGPLLQMKSSLLEPLFHNLDQAFLGLAETNIRTTVSVDQPIGIRFDLPLDQPLDLNFELPIRQQTQVRLTAPTRVENVQISFYLPGGGGVINGTGSIVLPQGAVLPVELDMVVPVQKTIPVQMTVPVSQSVPVEMSIPVSIQLGEAGLDPAVQRLRDVFTPVRALVESLPDGFRFK